MRGPAERRSQRGGNQQSGRHTVAEPRTRIVTFATLTAREEPRQNSDTRRKERGPARRSSRSLGLDRSGAGSVAGDGRRWPGGGRRAILGQKQTARVPCALLATASLYRSSAIVGGVAKLTCLGSLRIISG